MTNHVGMAQNLMNTFPQFSVRMLMLMTTPGKTLRKTIRIEDIEIEIISIEPEAKFKELHTFKSRFRITFEGKNQVMGVH